MKNDYLRRQLLGALILTLILLALGARLNQTMSVSAQGPGRGPVTVGRDYRHDISPALRTIPPVTGKPKPQREANPNPSIHPVHNNQTDPVVQGSAFLAAMPAPMLNFDGIPFPGVGCFCAPPDTNGEVGLTQYVQIVNEGYQVFNKSTGASVLGPVSIATIWSGFGGVCETAGDGDPVLLYDQLANRWVVTQFAGSGTPTDECIAVSSSSDATGTYNRYAFHLGTNFFDYPHLGVWPDAYYMAMDVYNSTGTARLGPEPFAFDRTAMLAGAPATFITTGITGGSTEDLFLPSDLDGKTLPPAGAPNSFVEWPGSGVYKVYHFHVDFGTPNNSTFLLFASPAAAGFTALCPNTRACVPEPNGSSLDGIGDRFMFRLAYRNFGDHEALVTNYTVSSGGVAGIRWIELRNVTSGPVAVFQESTYQPDTTWRWMGSAAMDGSGNLALGFSAASGSVVPGLRYAGRLANDPLNTLAQGEAVLFAGAGSQTSTGNRWGDYSDLTVDPVDDCTFWYTNEYYPSGSSQFNWRTRIGSFKFASCSAPAPTSTPTSGPAPTNTPLPPTPTNTPLPPTPTNTPVPPTPTATSLPPTPTNTPGSVTSTGFLAPSANAPQTVNAGDNNGYEGNPTNAYVADGLFATDANSGTGTSTSCTSTRKDKHFFYNYNFNIPTLTAVRGIQVQINAKADSTISSPKICFQLSWDGGTSWTAPLATSTLTTTNTTYTVGAPTNTWGRTWALGDFSNANFRVRVIDVASSTSRTFYLDSIAVNVTYQP